MRISTLVNSLRDAFHHRTLANALIVYPGGFGPPYPRLVTYVLSRVDPRNELPEGERKLRALGRVWQYYMKKKNLAGASRAAADILQTMRVQSQHYAALAAVQARGGYLDETALSLVKGYANVPNGRDLKLVNKAGRIYYEYRDADGRVVDHAIMTPEEIASDAMKLGNAATIDELLQQAARQAPALGQREDR